jgi:hypothetical protein
MSEGIAAATPDAGASGSPAEDTTGKSKGTVTEEKDDYVETRFEKLNAANRAKREGSSHEDGRRREQDRDDSNSSAAKDPHPVGKPKSENEKKAEQIAKDNDDVEKLGHKKYSVVVDGEKIEVTEEELLKGYQTRKASDKRFMEAAKEKKQAETFLRLLKENPLEVLKHPALGHDLRKLAEEYIYQELQKESMDPKERELLEYKEKIRKYEDQERKTKEDMEAKDREELKTKFAQDYHKDIIQALDKSGLPKSATTVKKMAFYLHQAAKRGYKVGAADVVDLVREDYTRELRDLYGSADGESLLSMLGEDVAAKIRNYDLKKVKGSFPVNPLGRDKQTAPKEERTRKKEISKDEWKERLQRIKDGLE